MHFRRRDQGAEEPGIFPLFRVPLHADEELAGCGGLDALDDAVVRPRDRHEALADLVHRLVVVGRDPEVLAAGQDRRDDRAAGDTHLVGAEPVRGTAVGIVPCLTAASAIASSQESLSGALTSVWRCLAAP
jgi:hypothetical protein